MYVWQMEQGGGEPVRTRDLAAAGLLALIVVGCAGPSDRAATSRCGIMPSLAPASGVPTPNVATSAVPATEALVVVVVLSWSDCVRPETVAVRAGDTVQWQQLEQRAEHELVLQDGTVLGRIRHVLEYRFTQPGVYPYEARGRPGVHGVVVVDPK